MPNPRFNPPCVHMPCSLKTTYPSLFALGLAHAQHTFLCKNENKANIISPFLTYVPSRYIYDKKKLMIIIKLFAKKARRKALLRRTKIIMACCHLLARLVRCTVYNKGLKSESVRTLMLVFVMKDIHSFIRKSWPQIHTLIMYETCISCRGDQSRLTVFSVREKFEP